jgi:predicted transcriptional regulator
MSSNLIIPFEERRKILLKYISKHRNGRVAKMVAKDVGWNRATTHRYMNDLCTLGELTRRKVKLSLYAGNFTYLYLLTEKGRQYVKKLNNEIIT